MGQKIKFGVVGIGHIGSRHVQCILDHPNAELSAICDILPKKKLRINNKDAIFCSSIKDLVLQDLDVINICTPNYLHASMAIEVLNSKKHVVIEKPLSLCVKDAQAVMEASIKNNKLVFGVMQNRFSPTVIWLRKIIQESILGEINLLLVNCFWNRNSAYYLNSNWHGSLLKDGGPLFTQFSHFIDIINWIFGDFSNISANFKSFNQKDYIEFEDSGIVSFDLKPPKNFQKNISATLTYSTSIWNKNFESSITIIGEKGTVKIGGQYMDKISYCNIENYDLPHIDTDLKCNDYGDYKGSASNHDKLIDTVINQILFNNADSIFLSSQDGVDVVNIIERIYSLRK
tara:strand:- start:517 stop:1548 length:1032 start_codon:yes stop_codon:yes gene_type:complete